MAVTADSLAVELGLGLGSVARVQRTAAGAGYVFATAPPVTIGAPPAGDGHRTATVVASVSNGGVEFYQMTDTGAGYATAPPVTVGAPPAGAANRVQATAIAILEPAVDAAPLLARAVALVDAYLRGGVVPEAIRDEAVIRTAGHIHARRNYGIVEGPMSAGSVRTVMTPVRASPVRQSGAAAMLAPWVRRQA